MSATHHPLPGLALDTLAYDQPADWMSTWTLFFWAWWVAWSPSSGRSWPGSPAAAQSASSWSATMIVPFTFTLLWISIFGNSSIDLIMNGNAAFGEAAMSHPERGFYNPPSQYPAFR